MRDPYLYKDVAVLKNLANIKDNEKLRQMECDLTVIGMAVVYAKKYDKFDINTLCDIHKTIFGGLYEWAGEFRTIQMTKSEKVLGGDTVRYAEPSQISKQLKDIFKEISKLKPNMPKQELVFKLVRITSTIWHIHPFREGNTRTVVAFSVLLADYLGIDLDCNLFVENASYVRNALVWCTQGIYSIYEYLERIYYDAASIKQEENSKNQNYEFVGEYKISDYKEQPHIYLDNE